MCIRDSCYPNTSERRENTLLAHTVTSSSETSYLLREVGKGSCQVRQETFCCTLEHIFTYSSYASQTKSDGVIKQILLEIKEIFILIYIMIVMHVQILNNT